MNSRQRILATTLGVMLLGTLIPAPPVTANERSWHHYYDHAMGDLEVADRLLLGTDSEAVWQAELPVERQLEAVINDTRYPPVEDQDLAFRPLPQDLRGTARMREAHRLLRSAIHDFRQIAGRGPQLAWSERAIVDLEQALADQEQAMTDAHVSWQD